MSERPSAENDAPAWTTTEALEHLLIPLERGEHVSYRSIMLARAALDAARVIPPAAPMTDGAVKRVTEKVRERLEEIGEWTDDDGNRWRMVDGETRPIPTAR